MKTVKQFFKHPETYIGIVSAMAFLLIFFCVWMTAYDGVEGRTNNLKIGFVNEDVQLGSMIEKEIIENVPFKIKTYHSVESAKQAMDQRKLDMVMYFPFNFSSQLQENGETKIHYFINQANASLAKQMMDGAAKNMTQTINESVYAYNQQIMISKLPAQLGAAVPSAELAQSLSNSITPLLQSLKNEMVLPSIEKTNHVDGFAATMVPMMIVLASFVGSMIMSLNINIVAIRLKTKVNKWAIFLARQLINIGASILLTLITLLFLALFNVELLTSLWEAGTFQLLVFFSFLSLTQMFVVLLGPGGMLFNILFLSLQLVTSGVIVPITLLSDFYQTIGTYLPATYAADGYYTVIFGGQSLITDMFSLLAVSTVTLFVTVGKIVFQKSNIQKSHALVAEK